MKTKIKARESVNGVVSYEPKHPLLPWPQPEEIDNVFLGDPADPYYYGYRLLIDEENPEEETLRYRPLTLDDILDPEEGDVLMQGTLHHQDTEALFSIFDYLHEQNPNLTVYSDLKIIWGIKGLSNPAPDVSIIPEVKQPEYPRQTFEVVKEGTSPLFVLEVVSPRYRPTDRSKKVPIYRQGGVKEYFIIDSHLSRRKGETETTVQYEIVGYRLEGGQYVDIKPDEQGWFYSEVNHVWIGVNEAKDGVLIKDARTDEIILPIKERAEAEAKRAEMAEERAEMSEERAEVAEERAEAEALARSQAEVKLAALEAELRKLRAAYKAHQDRK